MFCGQHWPEDISGSIIRFANIGFPRKTRKKPLVFAVGTLWAENEALSPSSVISLPLAVVKAHTGGGSLSAQLPGSPKFGRAL